MGIRLNISNLAIALSAIIFLAVCIITIDSYHLYVGTDGKGRALFGMLEFLNYGWKYWLMIPVIVCIGILVSRQTSIKKRKLVIGIVLNMISIAGIIAPVWRMFQYFYKSL